MLTSTQCRVVAYYVGDNDIVCDDCATQTDINEGTAKAMIAYEFEGEDWKDGAYCAECGHEISEPWAEPESELDPDDLAQFEPED